MSTFDIEHVRAAVEIAKDDETLITTLKAERVSLFTEITTDPEAGKEIYSGSGNGLSFNANVSFTKNDRLKFLNICIKAIEGNIQLSSFAIGRFY